MDLRQQLLYGGFGNRGRNGSGADPVWAALAAAAAVEYQVRSCPALELLTHPGVFFWDGCRGSCTRSSGSCRISMTEGTVV